MVFGFGSKKQRHVVATVLVAVDHGAAAAVQSRALAAAAAIVDDPDTFATASREVAGVARVLLDHQDSWSHAAAGGDVYDDEGGAAGQVADVYADLAGRYLAGEHGEDGTLKKSAGDDTSREHRCVIMLTVAYPGESDDIERELNDRNDLVAMLEGITRLHERDALLAAHVHSAPAHPEDRLTDEQMLVCFPELNPI